MLYRKVKIYIIQTGPLVGLMNNEAGKWDHYRVNLVIKACEVAQRCSSQVINHVTLTAV